MRSLIPLIFTFPWFNNDMPMSPRSRAVRHTKQQGERYGEF